MNKHSAASVHVSGLTRVCAETLPLIVRFGQGLLDKGVALGKPFDEIDRLHIIDRDVQVLVALEEMRVMVESPVGDGEYMCDFAVGQGLGTS